MEWNAGGWFGGQIGATCWMLVAGVLTAVRDLPTGLVVIALFLVPNALGLLLWRRRPLSCYAATQLLIAASGLCGLAAVFMLDRANTWTAIQTGDAVSATTGYWTVGLCFGVLLLVFYLRFGRDRNGDRDTAA